MVIALMASSKGQTGTRSDRALSLAARSGFISNFDEIISRPSLLFD
jgi:hypothetical protein